MSGIDELAALQQEKMQIEGRIRQVKMDIAQQDDDCIHDFYEVHDSMGDYRDPTGARCNKCGHQIWY